MKKIVYEAEGKRMEVEKRSDYLMILNFSNRYKVVSTHSFMGVKDLIECTKNLFNDMNSLSGFKRVLSKLN